MIGYLLRALIGLILWIIATSASAAPTWSVKALGFSATSCSAQDAATKVVTDFVNSRTKYSGQPTARNPSAVCNPSGDGEMYICQLKYEQRDWRFNSGPDTPVFTDWQNINQSADALKVPGADQCGVDPCQGKSGQSGGITNFSMGWSRGADGSDEVFPSDVNLTPSACIDGCAVTAVLGGCVSHWISKEPTSQGLYRLSSDCNTVHEGKSCVATDPKYSAGSPLTPPPACPGSLGEINGKTVCLGNSPGTNTKPKNYGNPRAGSSPADSAQTREPSPSNGGNTGAGGGPGVTGGGTSGTNTGGGPVGGNQGGGSDPDAPPDDEPQKSQCELTPNAAFCKEKVPIDETGTQSATGTLFDSAIQQLDQSKDSFLDLFPDAVSSDGKDTKWTFTFTLPSSCQAIETPIGQTSLTTGFKLDVCKYQPVIHDLMAMVWISGTIWLLIGMFGNTLRST